MGFINQTHYQYYTPGQKFVTNTSTTNSGLGGLFLLTLDPLPTGITKFLVFKNGIELDDSLYTFGITDDQAVRIKTVDGGYLLCANFTTKDDNVNGIGSKIFWCELDYNFDIIGKQVISDAGYYWEVGDIIKSRDGNIVIVGGTNKKEEGDNAIRPEKQRYLTKRSIENDTIFWINSTSNKCCCCFTNIFF